MDDIVTLMKHVCFFYNNLPLDGENVVSFKPTTERKYDFIRGVKAGRNGHENGRANGKEHAALDEGFGLLGELPLKALTAAAVTSKVSVKE